MTEQGTPEWKAERAGRVTSSRIADMLAKTKTGWGASRANYAAQLVAERLTGNVAEGFKSAAMEFGTEYEAEARAMYAFANGVDPHEVGFIPHHTIPMAGCSPDGLIEPDGLAEFKCPNTATHIETLRGASIPGRYMLQMQWQMACTGRAWCDFISYDPRMPQNMQMFIVRVPRDPVRIVEIEKEARAFLADVEDTVADLERRYGNQREKAA